MSVVLDASALLAFLFDEPGADRVEPVLAGSLVSSVNLAEVLGRFTRDGHDAAQVRAQIEGVGVRISPFDADQAEVAARLEPSTRSLGLSLGDRACLALGVVASATVYTADRDWAAVEPGVEIVVVR